MAKETDDFLMDEDGDDLIENGDLALGDGTKDDVWTIVKLNSNQLKSDPILGPNLALMMNGKMTKTDFKQLLDLHLQRDEKNAKKIEIENGEFNISL